MQLNIRNEIICSYEKLIRDCQIAIKNNVDVKKNLRLIEEYGKILFEVKNKPENAYDDVLKEMERMSKSDFKKTSIENLKYQEV